MHFNTTSASTASTGTVTRTREPVDTLGRDDDVAVEGGILIGAVGRGDGDRTFGNIHFAAPAFGHGGLGGGNVPGLKFQAGRGIEIKGLPGGYGRVVPVEHGKLRIAAIHG